MALSIRGGQEVPVHELIADANALNDWVIGVNYAAAGSADKSVNVEATVSLNIKKNNKIVVLRQLPNGYAALVLSVEFESGVNAYTYNDFTCSQSISDILSVVNAYEPECIIDDGMVSTGEIGFESYNRIIVTDFSLRKCFSRDNRNKFDSKKTCAVFNTVYASEKLAGFDEDVLSSLTAIKDALGSKYPLSFPFNVEFISPRTGEIIECLYLLFTENSIKRNWLA
jgi:hypothetical protein